MISALASPSIVEQLWRADDLVRRLQTFPTKATPDISENELYFRRRLMRGHALAVRDELEWMKAGSPEVLPGDSIARTSASSETAKQLADQPEILKRSLADFEKTERFRLQPKTEVEKLIKALEQTPFVKDKGRAVVAARPKNFPLLWRAVLIIKDASGGVMRYSRRRPLKAAGIAIASLLIKIYLAYALWEAISGPVKSVLHWDDLTKSVQSVFPMAKQPPKPTVAVVALPVPLQQQLTSYQMGPGTQAQMLSLGA